MILKDRNSRYPSDKRNIKRELPEPNFDQIASGGEPVRR